METADNQDTKRKVYAFDETRFTGVFVRRVVLIAVLYVCIIAALIVPIYFVLSKNGFTFFFPVVVVLIYPLYFFRARTLARKNYFEIIEDERPSAVLHIFGEAFEKQSVIKHIDTLKMTRSYIKINGMIEVSHRYFSGKPQPDVFIRKRLKIPNYFENMDEIYYELKKMKEPLYGESI